MVIFHSYVELPEGKQIGQELEDGLEDVSSGNDCYIAIENCH